MNESFHREKWIQVQGERVSSSANVSYLTRRYRVLGQVEGEEAHGDLSVSVAVVREKDVHLVQPLRTFWAGGEGQLLFQE